MDVNKQTILDNVAQYSAQQLVDFINQGTVTFDELLHDTGGQFAAAKRKEVKNLIENGDEDAWKQVQESKTPDIVQYYLDTFPKGVHRDEARMLQATFAEAESQSVDTDEWGLVDKTDINQVRQFIDSHPSSPILQDVQKVLNDLILNQINDVNAGTLIGDIHRYQSDHNLTPQQKDNQIIEEIKKLVLTDKKISKEDFLKTISEDHNLLNTGIVKKLIDDNFISIDDLLSVGIDKPFIQMLFKENVVQNFKEPIPLDRIHKQSTEVYFWGVPSSGKSCALGAILSVAASGKIAKTMVPDSASQGYGYLTKLINAFDNKDVFSLLAGTPISAFYEMGFDLVDQEEKVHPITCIDMAGELMRCMYKYQAHDEITDLDTQMLDTMTKVLIGNRSTSRKMHFFVIEYGAEDRLYEGLTQKVYLEGAVTYIKDTHIFEKDTDAIYILITKADKMKNLSREAISQYLQDNYLGFCNGLAQICKDFDINKGNVEKVAFSLGSVCFQNFCKFDSRPSENVVKILLQRSASYKSGKIGKIGRLFKQ
jgi:uncharacterized protein (UPF0297 family)